MAKRTTKKAAKKAAPKKKIKATTNAKSTSKKPLALAVAFAESPNDWFKPDSDVWDRNASNQEERYAVLVDAIDDWSDEDIYAIIRDESGEKWGWRMKPNINPS